MAAAAAISGAKRTLRAEMKQRLRALSAEERRRQSRLLTEKVIAHCKYQESQRISIFLSMQDEIETEEIIQDIFQSGKTCFIPRYKFKSSHMDMVKLFSAEEIFSLPKTSWNIHQPRDDEVREEALSTDSNQPYDESGQQGTDVKACCPSPGRETSIKISDSLGRGEATQVCL
ncbi:5-formyltetrahydrofolate cyclo-ligase isoform X2 [Petaurus breviceps papuanus]|uniref:5-formyltetrahydrofolate cyclo-ligase isoform X2 n=1 Tax=Petaurus breviceps papuanus TaxID=3040969 RepID=UPI0036DA4C92